MIEAVLSCECGMRYRATEKHLTRNCICGKPLALDPRETLRRLILESDAPLDVLIERVRSLSEPPR